MVLYANNLIVFLLLVLVIISVYFILQPREDPSVAILVSGTA